MVYSRKISTLFFLVFFKNELYGGASITIFGKMFVRNIFMTKPQQTWFQCLESCTNDPKCFAYSFGPVGEAFGHCTLTMGCETENSSCQEETIEVKGNVVHIVRSRRNKNGCYTNVSVKEGTRNNCQASNNNRRKSAPGPKVNISSNATISGHGRKFNMSSNATNLNNGSNFNISSNATISGHGPKFNISSNATISGHGPNVNISSNATISGHGPKFNISSNATNLNNGSNFNNSSNATISGHGPNVSISSNDTSSDHGSTVNISSSTTINPLLPTTLSCPIEVTNKKVKGEMNITVCQGKTGKIHCAPKNIVIKDAKYGRDQGCSCECGKCYNRSTECCAADVVEKLKKKCQKKVCHVKATNTEFGDPCPNVVKRLIVGYSCQ